MVHIESAWYEIGCDGVILYRQRSGEKEKSLEGGMGAFLGCALDPA